MIEPIEIVLPVPPSVNRIWVPVRTKGGARMVKRAGYVTWAAGAAREVQMQRGGQTIPGWFRVSILIPEGKYDGDNLIKPLLDACQNGGAIVNDRLCVGGTWDLDDTREGLALILLTPIPPTQRQPARNKGTADKETAT